MLTCQVKRFAQDFPETNHDLSVLPLSSDSKNNGFGVFEHIVLVSMVSSVSFPPVVRHLYFVKKKKKKAALLMN